MAKILYYNWIQFDNKEKIGGGVNIYQKNIIDYLINKTEHEIYFLSAGWKYNPLKQETYIKSTTNIYGNKCKTFEIINSSIIAPAYIISMNPEKFITDEGSCKIFEEFIDTYGPFDVIHFNNIEGISINTLRLKEKYPQTRFIVSIHNYFPICPLVQYFQNHNKCICHNFNHGNECLKCAVILPSTKEYEKRCKRYFYDSINTNNKILKLPLKIIAKILKYKMKNYAGSKKTMNADMYEKYRNHNIEYLNKYADSILAVSERVREIMIEYGINPEIIHTSYIGTKFAEKELKHSVAKDSTPFTIAYLGYERIDKGFFFFIDALSQLDPEIAKNINVVLAVNKLHKSNITNKLDNFNKVITYNGYTHDELEEILSTVNLGIVPVLWEDNLPQVAIEMVACGVPILCSSFGGASELCKSELFKFQGNNTKEFLEKLIYLVKNPKLLSEYWDNHPDLTSMNKHAKDLEMYYSGSNNQIVL